ncbi:MAG TPA: hypothetical protein DCF33_04125 [Saprospirales bacterium]|nr:hypothetical protein [Saprospirales bacterium]
MESNELETYRQQLKHLGEGGDLRSIGISNAIATLTDGQEKFDELFRCLFSPDRKTVMRAADAVEKVSIIQPDFLQKHAPEILRLCRDAEQMELKWHLALLLARVRWSKNDLQTVRIWLVNRAADPSESKIVRVNALQGLSALLEQDANRGQFLTLLDQVESENIPSLNARIKRLR